MVVTEVGSGKWEVRSEKWRRVEVGLWGEGAYVEMRRCESAEGFRGYRRFRGWAQMVLGVQGGWWCGGEWELREVAISGADSAIGWEVWLCVRCWCLV